MKTSTNLLIIVLLAFVGMAFVKTTEYQQKKLAYEEMKIKLDGNRAYTLELAEAMPAEKYSFRPHDSVRSFGEQLAHIAMSSQFLLDVFVNDAPMPSQEDFAKAAEMEKQLGADKAACIKALNDSFDAIEENYKALSDADMEKSFTVPMDPNSPEFAKSEAFDFIQDHMIHHRGQALVSLRMQNIAAPQYRLY